MDTAPAFSMGMGPSSSIARHAAGNPLYLRRRRRVPIEYNHAMWSSPAPPQRANPSGIRAKLTPRARWVAGFALLAFAAGAALAVTPGLGFSRSVTPGLVQRYAAKFGPNVNARISGWQEFVRSIPAARTPASADNLP